MFICGVLLGDDIVKEMNKNKLILVFILIFKIRWSKV